LIYYVFSRLQRTFRCKVQSHLSVEPDRPGTIIPHVHNESTACSRKFVHERFFDEKLDAIHHKAPILAAVKRLADPTDRSFDAVSSTHHGSSAEDAHHPTSFSNKADVAIGQV
jgi:hypothetical protein